MRPTTGLQQDPLSWRVLQVARLGNGPLERSPVAVDGRTLPFADVPVQYVLDVLHDEVDGHWWQMEGLISILLGETEKHITKEKKKKKTTYPYCQLPLELWHRHTSSSEGEPNCLRSVCGVRHWKVGVQLVINILTGKQNSSKAGLTNVVYCVRICSRSRPLVMSRRTTGELSLMVHMLWQVLEWCVLKGETDTSARQPDVGVCVHKELHVEHVTHFLGVEDQDPLEKDHVCWVNCDSVVQPGNTHEFSTKRQLFSFIFCFFLSYRLNQCEILPSYLEWLTKSYVGTSTTFPSTMSFKVLYINSVSNASARNPPDSQI